MDNSQMPMKQGNINLHPAFYLFDILETVLPQLLNALCSGNLTPVEHLEQQQVSDRFS